MNEDRKKALPGVRSMVVKLGTQLLARKEAGLDLPFMTSVARQIVELCKRGISLTIVSSGAVGCGLRELNLKERPTDLAHLQAVAAVGQRRLMDGWAEAFSAHHAPVAQILLTREDIDDRARFLNLRNTIAAVHAYGAIPIVNENDTVSTDELVKITFGDNDILAATVAHALQANLLVLLSVVDGLLDEAGSPVRQVESVEQARQLVRAEKSPLGKGGMESKLLAAKMVTDAGEAMAVADGRMENVLLRLMDGEDIGTLFVSLAKRRHAKSRWIGSVRPIGKIVIDAGACKALSENNRSLLAAGVVSVSGSFDRGDVVSIISAEGHSIARGLSNYSSTDLERIRGKKTAEVRTLLAESAYDEVVHRDNLVLDLH